MRVSRPQIMGIVNVTPDSFSDGGRLVDAAAAIAHGLQLVAEGADSLDIGGESTRPGADPVVLAEEMRRVIPVIEGLSRATSARLSIDTRKPEVAQAAVKAGAVIWNDVSALTFSEESLNTARGLECEVVLMHAQGDPKTMQIAPHYGDVVEEVFAFLAGRVAACEAARIDRARMIVDPGLGFGKTVAHNLELIAGLQRFTALGVPVLIGASRKGFIGKLDRDAPTQSRLGGSIAAALEAARRGASILRVHDVAATRQALAVAAAIP